jgi:hypothetical protein
VYVQAFGSPLSVALLGGKRFGVDRDSHPPSLPVVFIRIFCFLHKIAALVAQSFAVFDHVDSGAPADPLARQDRDPIGLQSATCVCGLARADMALEVVSAGMSCAQVMATDAELTVESATSVPAATEPATGLMDLPRELVSLVLDNLWEQELLAAAPAAQQVPPSPSVCCPSCLSSAHPCLPRPLGV